MAGGGGAGPSRRSHTKSRKGCKTCKRRHIRCDETFPQCRNCTKHQVRCDYMENVGPGSDGRLTPDQPRLLLSPENESLVDLWQQTGAFPFPQLSAFPQLYAHDYTRDELRLLVHLASICNTMNMRGTSNLALWTMHIPQLLQLGVVHPFVMQGVFAFAANHLAWLTTSNETRNLYLQHASVSLRGLHDAINTFSQINADAVLAASLLLLWQATDWRSWNSLRTGIQSVVAAMQSWQYNSVFHEFLDDDEVLLGSVRTHRRHSSIAPDDRSAVLENVAFSLQRLQLSLLGHEQENGWVAQLITYVEHLQGLHASPTPEEQFNTMYRLRKWLFWVPIALLEQQDGQGPALLTLAHFYATALVLQPLFPDLGATFCAAMATGPLNAIINVTDAMQSQQGLSSNSFEIASMLQFPRQTALSYRSRALQEQQHFGAVPSPLQLSASALNFSAIGNLSPAFAASPMNYSGGPTTPQPGTPNSSYSPYLDPVHTPPLGYAYPAQSWSTGSASGHPLNTYTVAEEDMYSFDNASHESFHGPPIPAMALEPADFGHLQLEQLPSQAYPPLQAL